MNKNRIKELLLILGIALILVLYMIATSAKHNLLLQIPNALGIGDSLFWAGVIFFLIVSVVCFTLAFTINKDSTPKLYVGRALKKWTFF